MLKFFQKKEKFVEDNTYYLIKLPKTATFHTRSDARDLRRAVSKALASPDVQIVVHEFKDGYELPERVVS